MDFYKKFQLDFHKIFQSDFRKRFKRISSNLCKEISSKLSIMTSEKNVKWISAKRNSKKCHATFFGWVRRASLLGPKGTTVAGEGCSPPQELGKWCPQGGTFSSQKKKIYSFSRFIKFVLLCVVFVLFDSFHILFKPCCKI